MRLLVVEDEPKTAAYLKTGLTENGFVVDVANRGDEGLHLALTEPYDLLILDVMLPAHDGWSILSTLRAGLPHRLLKFSGGSVDAYATCSVFTSPSC